jgi:hypothetical protein
LDYDKNVYVDCFTNVGKMDLAKTTCRPIYVPLLEGSYSFRSALRRIIFPMVAIRVRKVLEFVYH